MLAGKRRSTILFIVQILYLYGCATGGDGAGSACDGPCLALDQKILSAIFEATTIEAGTRVPDPVLGNSASFWRVKVSAVMWRLDRQIISATTGSERTYSPMEVGDTIIVTPDDAIRLDKSASYVFVTNEFAAGEIELPEWNPYMVFASESALPLSGMSPPFEVFLSPDEDTAAEKFAAVVELIDQAFSVRQAQKRKEPVVIGDRLQAVLDWRKAQEPPPRNPAYDEIGAGSFDEYMEKSPEERQLSDSGVMPDEVMEALDLVPITILVIHPLDFATKDVAYMGGVTPVGFLGPYQISTEYGFSEIGGTRPRTGGLQLVTWSRDDIFDDPESIGSNYLDLSVPEAVTTGLANLHPEDTHLIVDLVAGTFEITDFPGMLDRQAELIPHTVYTGTTVR